MSDFDLIFERVIMPLIGKIKGMFPKQYELTVVARNKKDDDDNLVITEDKIGLVIRSLQKIRNNDKDGIPEFNQPIGVAKHDIGLDGTITLIIGLNNIVSPDIEFTKEGENHIRELFGQKIFLKDINEMNVGDKNAKL